MISARQINCHLGQRIRMERRRRKLTQKELAYACGVTFQVIHKYEAGLVNISAGKLWSIAEALSISVSDLFPLKRALQPPLDQAAGLGSPLPD